MMQISLRQLMLLVVAVAVAIVSLAYASELWLVIVVGGTMLAFFAALILSAVDRGPRQAFAIGFALTMVGYWSIVLMSTKSVPNPSLGNVNGEFDQWEGRLPTTWLLRYIHMGVDRSGYYDFAKGVEVPDYDPAKDPNRNGGGGFGALGGGLGGRSNISYRELPPREYFMPTGHCWWGLLLGYLGGLFAAFVYARRIREQAAR
jgi:hypothetical protein